MFLAQTIWELRRVSLHFWESWFRPSDQPLLRHEILSVYSSRKQDKSVFDSENRDACVDSETRDNRDRWRLGILTVVVSSRSYIIKNHGYLSNSPVDRMRFGTGTAVLTFAKSSFACSVSWKYRPSSPWSGNDNLEKDQVLYVGLHQSDGSITPGVLGRMYLHSQPDIWRHQLGGQEAPSSLTVSSGNFWKSRCCFSRLKRIVARAIASSSRRSTRASFDFAVFSANLECMICSVEWKRAVSIRQGKLRRVSWFVI